MFREIIAKTAQALDKHKIAYMIIGGQAVLLYGEPRLTRDIDISLGIDTGRLPEVLEIVKEIGLVPLTKDISAFVNQTMVLPALDEPTGVRVDFIFSNTPFFAPAFVQEGAREAVWGRQTLAVAIYVRLNYILFRRNP